MKKIVPISKIISNQIQPNINFDEKQLQKAIDSGNKLLVVKENGDKFEIVFGEKIFKILKDKVSEIEVNVIDFKEKNIINKLKFKDISLIEEAILYLNIMNEANMTQEELAKKSNKSQSTIANKIRLLKLPQEVQDALVNKKITERHGRCLLKLEDEEILKVFNYILENDLNVRESEEYILRIISNKKRSKKSITKGFTRNIQIGINSINQCMDMMKKMNIEFKDEIIEEDEEIVYKITLYK